MACDSPDGMLASFTDKHTNQKEIYRSAEGSKRQLRKS